MIDDAAKTETIDEIFIVGSTNETTSDVSAANIKENIAQIPRKAKTLTPTITVSSVLPSKRRANPDRRADVNMKMKEACNELDVKFVDNDANFTFLQRGCWRRSFPERNIWERSWQIAVESVSLRTATET